MNRFLAMSATLFFTLILSSTLIFAAEKNNPPKDRGPDIINLKMGVMVLPFQHWKHQSTGNFECFNCHKAKIGKIDGWSEAFAHKTCIPCHELENKGPVQCHECHK